MVALCGVLAMLAWVRTRGRWPIVGAPGGSAAHRLGWLLSPVTLVAIIGTEAVAGLADRVSDRLRLDGVTETSRRDTLYVVAIAGVVGIVDDLVGSPRLGHGAVHRLVRAGVWALGFFMVADQAIGGDRGPLAAAALVAAVSGDAGAEIERRTPGLGIAGFVLAAGVAAVLTDRSPQLAGLAVALGAAVVVAAAATRRLGLAGAGTAGIAGAALAAGVLLDGGSEGVRAALVGAVAVLALTELSTRLRPGWRPVTVASPPLHPGGDHAGYADLP